MCGIFGILVGAGSSFPSRLLKDTVDTAFKLSESRGKEASGIAVRVGQSIYVLKEPVAASQLIRSEDYRRIFSQTIKKEGYTDRNLEAPFAVLGHSRLVTNGQSEINSNNQPVTKDGAVGVHNGIIVNDADLWNSFPSLEKKYDVDTEVFLSLLQRFHKNNSTLEDAAELTFSKIQGSASVAVLFDDLDSVLLATNTGSLYTCPSRDGGSLIFASERYILKRLLSARKRRDLFDVSQISQIEPWTGRLVDLGNMEKKVFSLKEKPDENLPVPTARINQNTEKLKVKEISPPFDTPLQDLERYRLRADVKRAMIETWKRLYSGELKLKLCTRCILPETTPFITFDREGVCNYCRKYEKRGSILEGEQTLENLVSKYQSPDGKPDCVVGFSGGRDSSYGLDYIKNHLKLNPITFIYDWGMVTDLARRNQARVCAELGIEQIVISADIERKRGYIRNNLEAWLKKPDLGMVPILMAGDKKFYHYFHKIRKENGIRLFIFCGGYEGEESTGLFKLGFCGVNRDEESAEYRMTGIDIINKLKLLWYYFKNYLTNPAYINKSIFDTLFAYYASYMLPDDYVYLFNYIEWDEETIVSTIREKFDWEQEVDTVATWRTDDGTAAIYNYIYLAMAGFTEFDTIRSQQIREGKLTREEALEMTKQENKPRFESIEWYAQVVGVDVNKMISIINSAPKLYRTNA